MAAKKILFVCTANICRSPTAAVVMRKMAADAGLPHFEVDSAGTHDFHIGSAADPRAVRTAWRRGYDLSSSRARQIRVQDFERFDLVLAMDFANLRALQTLCPPARQSRLGMLMSYATRSQAIVVHDPYGRSQTEFERALDYIEDACFGLLQTLSAEEFVVPLRQANGYASRPQLSHPI